MAITFEDKIAELNAAGKVEGEDFISHRVTSKHFSIHRPLKATEMRAFLLTPGASTKSVDMTPEQTVGVLDAATRAALGTCEYPSDQARKEAHFDRFSMAAGDIIGKLMAMAGGNEYTGPKA